MAQAVNEEMARKVFGTFDVDGSGTIDSAELIHALAEAGLVISEKQSEFVLRKYRETGCAELGLDTFTAVLSDLKSGEGLFEERLSLRTHPLVLSTLDAWWQCALASRDAPIRAQQPSCLRRQDYQSILKRVLRAMFEDCDEDDAKRIAADEAKADCPGAYLEEQPFMDGIFELADRWCDDVSGVKYAEFLSKLLNTDLTMVDATGVLVWKPEDHIAYGGYKEEAIVDKPSLFDALLKRRASSSVPPGATLRRKRGSVLRRKGTGQSSLKRLSMGGTPWAAASHALAHGAPLQSTSAGGGPPKHLLAPHADESGCPGTSTSQHTKAQAGNTPRARTWGKAEAAMEEEAARHAANKAVTRAKAEAEMRRAAARARAKAEAARREREEAEARRAAEEAAEAELVAKREADRRQWAELRERLSRGEAARSSASQNACMHSPICACIRLYVHAFALCACIRLMCMHSIALPEDCIVCAVLCRRGEAPWR